jgi:hypothetical protein
VSRRDPRLGYPPVQEQITKMTGISPVFSDHSGE